MVDSTFKDHFKDKTTIIFLILLGVSTLVRYLIFKDTPFFNDELIVNSKGFYTNLDILNYSLHSSYHPPLYYFVQKFLNFLGIYHENIYRFTNLSIYTLVILISWFKLKDYFFKGFHFLILITSYFFYFSLINTNYVLGLSFLILFLTFYLKQRLENEDVISYEIQVFAALCFFSNYTAGLICLLLLLIDGFLFNKQNTLKIITFQAFASLLVTITNLYPKYEEFNFLILSFFLLSILFALIKGYFDKNFHPREVIYFLFVCLLCGLFINYLPIMLAAYLSLFLCIIYFKAYEYLSINRIMLPVFFWLNFRILKFIYVIDIHDAVIKKNPLSSFSLGEFSPYLVALFFFFLFMFLYIKNSDLFKKNIKQHKINIALFITIILSLLPFLIMLINGRQVYARYLIFSLPLIYLFISFYLFKNINLIKIRALVFGIILLPNLLAKPKEVSYLGLQNSRSIYEKITSHGSYGNFILFFSDLYDWHTFYFRDYKIEKNFKLFTFLKSCDESTMDKALKMAGQNAFFVNYYRDCPQLKEYILNNCEKYNSKCFDLGAEDGHVILKIFEPETQIDNIRQLEEKYPKLKVTEPTR
jgi:hypothetical protein